jgi:superfamily II helicase
MDTTVGDGFLRSMIETVSIDVDLIVGGYGAVDFLLRPLVPN